MPKNTLALCLLSLSLWLGACGQAGQTVEPPTAGLPVIPLAVRPDKPTCTKPSAVEQAGGVRAFRFQNFTPQVTGPTAQATLAPTVENELLGARVLLNTYYDGFSGVDRQSLHRKYEAAFRTDRPGDLANYGLDTRTDDLMGEYIDAMQDGHTYFLDAQSWQAITDIFQGGQQPVPGFGFGFQPVPGQDGAVLVSVRGDGPAFAAGLRRGDVITEIGGQVLKRLVSDDARQVLAYIDVRSAAAAKQTPVVVKFRRAGSAVQTVSLTGALLNSANLPWGTLVTDPSGVKQFYLNLPSFAPDNVGKTVHALVAQAQAAGARGMIVDLRNDGGGQLSETYAAAGAFAPDTTGNVLEDISADDTTLRYAGGNLTSSSVCRPAPVLTRLVANPQVWTGKVAVLVNASSASGSEYFAQALRLGGRATIIGETTAGDGNTFTNFFEIAGARAMAVTLGRARGLDGNYYPAAQTPMIAAKDDLTQLATGNDLALNAAYSSLDK